ncbi:hypothetical protein [Streptomyces sp. NPDC094049]|uniref:hypothetical protein n=1 Tax=Streptomyces sp. NPDC094049 TaxID=3154987 RepID=UPI003322F224
MTVAGTGVHGPAVFREEREIPDREPTPEEIARHCRGLAGLDALEAEWNDGREY